jgi:hypothetical protein
VPKERVVSGLFGFIVGGLAERLVPVLQTPIEDIIYEVLDQKGLPTRAEVRDLRNKLDRLEKSLGDLKGSVEQLAREVEEVPVAPKQPVPSQKLAKVVKLASVQKPAEAASAAARTCKVDGCENAVRAKGLCGKHYQRYKRGTLDGFVGESGATMHENVQYMVGDDGAALAGQPVVTRYEGDEVIFLLPESDGRVIRGKVNDWRID